MAEEMKCGFELGTCKRPYMGKTKDGHRSCQFHLDKYERDGMFDLVEKAINYGISRNSSMSDLYAFIDGYILGKKQNKMDND